MARRDQPYIPLYVQDFLTDEKLNECSAESAGVYIRLMCLMHKSHEYGVILLKQKDKQTDNQITNFALKLMRHMPYDTATIQRGLTELLEEGVIQLEGDRLYQRRMVKDGKISEIRAQAGKKGGKQASTEKFANASADDFATAKTQANSENEIEIENETETDNKKRIDKDQKNKRKARKTPKSAPDKIRYAEFVYMTEAEHMKLVEVHGVEKTARMIEKLDNYKGSKGKTYKNDYRAILSWVVDEVNKEFYMRGGGNNYGGFDTGQGNNGTANPQSFKPSTGFTKFGE